MIGSKKRAQVRCPFTLRGSFPDTLFLFQMNEPTSFSHERVI